MNNFFSFRLGNFSESIIFLFISMSLELTVDSTNLHFTQPNLMERKSQHQHQGPGPAGGHHPAQHASTTGNDREDALAKAKTIEELVAPVFSFPFTATYTSELEISDFEDTRGNIAEITIEATGQNQIQSSHVTAARSWDQPSQIQHGKHSSRDQPAFVAWEYQAPVDEPFNHVGEVVFESAGGRQGKGYGGEFRCRKGQKR